MQNSKNLHPNRFVNLNLVKYLVRRMAHKRVTRLSIRGLMTSDGSLGRAKNPSVACPRKHALIQEKI